MRGAAHGGPIAPRALSTLLPASLERYVDRVWLGRPAAAVDAIPLTALDQHRGALLDAMARRYAGDPARHAAPMLSQWSKHYFYLAVPAALATALVLRRPLAMPVGQCALSLRDGMPAALYLSADALGEPGEEPAARYRSLCDDHLRHVIAAVCGMARLAPRVLWSNAGDLLDALFEQSGVFPDRGPEGNKDENEGTGKDEGTDRAWLFRDADDNPLRCAVRWVTPRAPRLGPRFHARRVCCTRSEIPGETQLCANCPKLLTMSDAELAAQDAAR